MLLYLTKCSQPDLCNVVRELSKCMDKATMGTNLDMLGVIKFVNPTKLLTEYTVCQIAMVAMTWTVMMIKVLPPG
jgi:hypothetical protein